MINFRPRQGVTKRLRQLGVVFIYAFCYLFALATVAGLIAYFGANLPSVEFSPIHWLIMFGAAALIVLSAYVLFPALSKKAQKPGHSVAIAFLGLSLLSQVSGTSETTYKFQSQMASFGNISEEFGRLSQSLDERFCNSESGTVPQYCDMMPDVRAVFSEESVFIGNEAYLDFVRKNSTLLNVQPTTVALFTEVEASRSAFEQATAQLPRARSQRGRELPYPSSTALDGALDANGQLRSLYLRKHILETLAFVQLYNEENDAQLKIDRYRSAIRSLVGGPKYIVTIFINPEDVEKFLQLFQILVAWSAFCSILGRLAFED